MSIPARLSLVTLAVRDVASAALFYERLGWRRSSASQKEIVFFDLGGLVLALFDRNDLAADAGVAVPATSTGSFALAINMGSRAEVDAALVTAMRAGGGLLRAATETGWGGYTAYVCDPDGHAWELAWNPFWPLDSNGRVSLPA